MIRFLAVAGVRAGFTLSPPAGESKGEAVMREYDPGSPVTEMVPTHGRDKEQFAFSTNYGLQIAKLRWHREMKIALTAQDFCAVRAIFVSTTQNLERSR